MRWLLSIVLGALLAGCSSSSFNTIDLYRPLPVGTTEADPKVSNALRRTNRNRDTGSIDSSFRVLYGAMSRLSVQKYKSWYAEENFPQIKEALEFFPENPLAWNTLAAYLMLQRRPELAAVSAGEALKHLERAEGKAAEVLQPILTTTRINRAMFLNLAGEYQASAELLEGMHEPITKPMERVAFAWAKVISMIGLGRAEEAIIFLRDNELLLTRDMSHELAPQLAWEYPQYAEPRKLRSIYHLLLGEARLVEGEIGLAIQELNMSVELDPAQWDAHLALGNALYASGDFVGARKKFEILTNKTTAHSVFNFNLVHFNLGNTLMRLDQARAAIDAFNSVLDADRKDRKSFKEMVKALPELIEERADLEREPPLFYQAHNNIGTALIDESGKEPANREALLREAEKHFREVVTFDPVTAWPNIAETLLMRNRAAEGLDVLKAAANESSETKAALLDRLVQFSLKCPTNELRFEGVRYYLTAADSMPKTEESLEELHYLAEVAPSLLNEGDAAVVSAWVAELLGRYSSR